MKRKRLCINAAILALFLLTFASPTSAVMLTHDTPITFTFDFTGDALAPPYEYIWAEWQGIVTDGLPLITKISEVYYTDPLDKVGSQLMKSSVEVNKYTGESIGFGTGNTPPQPFMNNVIYADFVMDFYSEVDIQSITAKLAIFDHSSEQWVYTESVNGQVAQTPEPATMLLLGLGLLGVLGIRRKMQK